LFLYKALVDLNSGKYLLEAFNSNKIEIDIEKIYFELQQSAEKLLKSILCTKTFFLSVTFGFLLGSSFFKIIF